ncbi:hypothetical protein AD949_13310 [Acetobacter orleanensis]|nr:hypothetical protein AD949_13310 [Acetobacter orleanensis]PCD80550.1 hypothetical protein CO710_02030 [Acetobacter orleanensis]
MTPNGQDLPRPLHKRALRVLTFMAAGVLVLPVLCVVILVVRMQFGPLNVTPIIRPFLPMAVLGGQGGQPAAATLTLRRASLQWNGLRDGLSVPVTLSLHDVRILKADNTTADTIRAANVTLDPIALVHGSIALRTVDLSGVRMALRRGTDGSVGLDVDAPPAPASSTDKNGSLDPSSLQRIGLTDTQVTIDDRLTHIQWIASPITSTLHVVSVHGATGVTGSVAITFQAQQDTTERLSITAQGAQTDQGTVQWHLTLASVRPSTFAGLAPALKTLDVPVSLTADTTFAPAPPSAWLLPQALDVKTDFGEGELQGGGSTYLLSHGGLAAHVALDHRSPTHTPATITLQSLTLALLNPEHPEDANAGITVGVTGQLNASDLFSPTVLSGQMALDIPTVPFGDIASYWPAKAAKGGRKWVENNITDGTAHDLHTAITLHSDKGWNGVKLTSLKGSVEGSDLTVHWLRPISPLHHLDAHLEVNDLDKLTIHFDHAYQLVDRADKNVGATGIGRVAAGPGSMEITGLSRKDQMGTIKTELRGNLRDLLAMLAEPRLHLLSRHPISFTRPSGQASAKFSLTLPLESKVTTDQMVVDAHAQVSNTHLGNVVAGRAITDGTFQIAATTQQMELSGHGVLGGLPSDITYFMNFRSLRPQDTAEKAHLFTRITPETANAAGIDTSSHFYGSADLGVEYARQANKHGTVNINLDLKRSAIIIPLWHKETGHAAQVSATLALLDGHITSVENIFATGPDLDVRGHAVLREKTAPELLVSSFKIARSTGHARLVLPYASQDKTIQVGVYADTLDLAPLMESDPNAPKKASAGYHVPEAATGRLHGPPGNAWTIDMTANALYYSQTKQPLRTVTAHFEDNGQRLERMRFAMRGPSPVTMTLEPTGGVRSLHVNIPDMGGFLAALNILPNVQGGHATLTGAFDDTQASAPFKGTMHVSPFVLKKAPATVLLARNLSLYGWLSARKSPEFEVSQLIMPVTFSDGVLTIQNGRMGNDALGATLEGTIDLGHSKLDLNGTVVPIFALNKLPGKLPGIGKLFSPEQDGGLLAMTFGIAGKLENPDLSVNPYSVLLPGVLRKLF